MDINSPCNENNHCKNVLQQLYQPLNPTSHDCGFLMFKKCLNSRNNLLYEEKLEKLEIWKMCFVHNKLVGTVLRFADLLLYHDGALCLASVNN